MAKAKENIHEAMIIPKGARIIAGNGSTIELDVQGDLVLQESQKGLTSLVSHNGSILIDEGVVVKSDSIRAKGLIRVRGSLETEELKSEEISLEDGVLSSENIRTGSMKSVNSSITTNAIQANDVEIRGGEVEIGSIIAEKLRMKDHVAGTVLITNAKDRVIDESTNVRGNFESDVELLGYLLKYRSTIFTDRVLNELKDRNDSREVKRFFLSEEDASPSKEVALDIDEVETEDEVSIDASPESEEVEAAKDFDVEIIDDVEEIDDDIDDDVEYTLRGVHGKLVSLIPEDRDLPPTLKLVLSGLSHEDAITLAAIFKRWRDNLDKELEMFSDEVKETVYSIKTLIDQ